MAVQPQAVRKGERPPADPEASFAVADPGKEWRRGQGIPVVPAFDGYRALAILGVVLFHVFLVSGILVASHDSAAGLITWALLPRGIEVLFVVSGFVVYLPTVARDGDFGRLGAYAIRRGARILPAYWLALVVALILLATVPGSPGVPGVGPIALHFTMLQTPALMWDAGFPLGLHVIAPVWTLSPEITYYIVLPFVAVFFFRRPLLGLAGAVAIVVAWHFLGHNPNDVATAFGGDLSEAAQGRIELYYASQFPNWTFAFAVGMLGAWAYVRVRDRWPAGVIERRAAIAAVLGLLALIPFVYLAWDEAVGNGQGIYAHESLAVTFGYPAALATTMVALALAPAWMQWPVANGAIRWVADISYGVYLIHFAVIWLARNEFSLPHDQTLWAVVAWSLVVFPASLAYGYLSARFLERPIRRWAHRFGRRRQAAAEARASA
jgi:peptidoglycan/LPS O-acetylase OafA/YrhL